MTYSVKFLKLRKFCIYETDEYVMEYFFECKNKSFTEYVMNFQNFVKITFVAFACFARKELFRLTGMSSGDELMDFP